MPHVVVGALVNVDRILLGRRSPSRRWYPDVWDLLGGHVGNGGEADVTLGIWRVRRWQGTPTNRSPDEHDLLGWFTAGDLAGLALAHADYHPLLQEEPLTER